MSGIRSILLDYNIRSAAVVSSLSHPVQKDMLYSITMYTCFFLYKNRVAKSTFWDLGQKLSNSSATCQAEIGIELKNTG